MHVRLVAFRRSEDGLRSVHDIIDVDAFTPKGRLSAAFQQKLIDLLEDETWVTEIELTRIKADDPAHDTGVEILRKCPACRVWNRHSVEERDVPDGFTPGNAQTASQPRTKRKSFANCANCGHVWPCRVTAADRG